MEITVDDFLNGKVRLAQYKEGYRSTSDSVLLSSAVCAKKGETVLDVGTGNGVVLFCLAERVSELDLLGIDIQDDLISLANKNNEINNRQIRFVCGDIFQKPSLIKNMQFHHVVTNPPFYTESHARLNIQQRIAFQERVPLNKWIRFCIKQVRASGTFTMIHRMEALPEILNTLFETAIGGIEVIPLVKDLKTPAKRVIVRGKLGSKKPFLLKNPLVLHGDSQKGYTEPVDAILRAGASLDEVFK